MTAKIYERIQNLETKLEQLKVRRERIEARSSSTADRNEPADWVQSPASMRNSVLFPVPFEPATIQTSPRPTAIDALFNARTEP